MYAVSGSPCKKAESPNQKKSNKKQTIACYWSGGACQWKQTLQKVYPSLVLTVMNDNPCNRVWHLNGQACEVDVGIKPICKKIDGYGKTLQNYTQKVTGNPI